MTNKDSDLDLDKDIPPQVPDSCGSGEFACASGQCYSYEQRCNDVEDCADGSDELGCRK